MRSGGLVLGDIVVYELGNVFKVILSARESKRGWTRWETRKSGQKCDFGRYNLTEKTTWEPRTHSWWCMRWGSCWWRQILEKPLAAGSRMMCWQSSRCGKVIVVARCVSVAQFSVMDVQTPTSPTLIYSNSLSPTCRNYILKNNGSVPVRTGSEPVLKFLKLSEPRTELTATAAELELDWTELSVRFGRFRFSASVLNWTSASLVNAFAFDNESKS